MKRVVLTLIMLLGVLAVRAGNTLSVTSASGHPQDEVTIHVSLANTTAAVAFQTEIPLGSQLNYVSGSVALNPARVTDHQVTAAVVNGNLRIYVFSLSLTPFVGSQGNLLSFTLKLKNEPGDYPLSLSNSILSNALSTSIPFTPQNGQVTILSPKLQVNTTTIDYGHVPIRSEYTQSASVTNVGNEPLTITGITFSNPVFSCPSFTQTTLQPNGSANFTFKFAPMVKGGVTATATLTSNSIGGNGVISLLADPFAVNELHIDYVTGYCDSIVEVPITMNNMESIIGFQIDMNLPQQLEYVDFTLSNRNTNHVSTGVFNEGVLRLMAYSPSGAAFMGDDGLIGTLRLKLQGLYGNYYLNPFKAVLADANGEDVLSAKYQGRVTIRSPRISGNASLDMGSTPVNETVTEEYVVYNNGNASMRIDQVVFDQIGFSVSESFPIIVPQNSNTTLHISYNRELAGDFTALMKIYSNDPQNGLKNVTLQGHRFEPNTLELSVETESVESDVEVSIQLQNYSDLVALQLNFSYPHSVYSVGQEDFVLTDRFSNHVLYVIPVNDSTYCLFVVSMQNRLIEGHEGEAIKVTMHPVSTPSMDQDYEIAVSEVILSDPAGVNLASESGKSLTFRLALTQANELFVGWNWYSSYVEYDGNALVNFENSLSAASTSAYIKSQSDGFASLEDNSWAGTLNELFNEQMYLIQVTQDAELITQGLRANPQNHPITLSSGWNWIGYLSSKIMSLDEALNSVIPSENDVIKGQTGFSAYSEETGWMGSLNAMSPGQGYIYLNNSTSETTLVYPKTNRNYIEETATSKHWSHDPHRFPTNLTMMVTLDENEFRLADGLYEIGAFVNGECRGSARIQYLESLGNYVAFLTVCGEEGEEVSFRLFDVASNKVLDVIANEQIVYHADAVHGSLKAPMMLHFRNTGVNDEHHEVSLFPNPTTGKVTVKAVGMNRLTVTDVLGQVVSDTEVNADQIELNLSNCESGLYMIHVNTDTFTVVRRFVLAK